MAERAAGSDYVRRRAEDYRPSNDGHRAGSSAKNSRSARGNESHRDTHCRPRALHGTALREPQSGMVRTATMAGVAQRRCHRAATRKSALGLRSTTSACRRRYPEEFSAHQARGVPGPGLRFTPRAACRVAARREPLTLPMRSTRSPGHLRRLQDQRPNMRDDGIEQRDEV